MSELLYDKTHPSSFWWIEIPVLGIRITNRHLDNKTFQKPKFGDESSCHSMARSGMRAITCFNEIIAVSHDRRLHG